MNSDKRDMMVASVQETFDKWPSFYDMPIVDKPGNFNVEVKGTQPFDEAAYLKALYEFCERGEPSGRMGISITGNLWVV